MKTEGENVMLLRDALREVEYSPAFQDAYKQLWYEACHEAQLARAVVEAAEGWILPNEVEEAISSYRAEFPQPDPVETDW